MSNKSKKVTTSRKIERAVKATKAPVVVAPRTISAIASDLSLTPKNARRILRAMKAQGTIPNYDAHNKGDRHFLTPSQEQAFKARVMRVRTANTQV